MRPPLAILFLADWLLASAVRHAPASPVAHTVEVPALLEEGNVFHYGHQVLKKLHSETDASQGDEFISYLAKTTMEKCAELKVAQNASNATEQLKRTLKEVCQETDSSHVVSEIFSLMNDALVAKWICGGLTAVDYMSANELEQCQDAGKVVLGGLTGMMEAKGKGKMLATMQTYALKLAVIFVPLPPPLGVIIEKGANLALSSLANDATSHLENLETKMSAMMRKSLSQELLRLGTAQARAADEQIQEMITLDALLNDMVSKSSKLFGGDFAAAMARVTSFNRWAIIEHDLSTSTEVLRPPDEMQRLEERAHFARLMETHLEMYILVLSQMHRSLGDRASLEIQASLTRKAQRMARLLLPDLILHSQSVSVSSASRQLQIFGSSPLLSSVGSRCSSTKPSPREALCCRLLGRPEFHLEFLVTCLWLPLMDPPNGDFAYPLRVDGFSTEQACFLAPDASMRQPDELPDLVQDGLASCANHQVLQSLHQEWTQRTFFSDQEQIHYMCGDPTERRITLLPFTFDTDGLCLERVRLFQNDVVAVLTSVHFESRLEHQLSEINRSTCRLAYRTSGVPYGGLKQWDLRSTLPTLRRHNGSVCDHCHWASPYSCAFQPRKPQPKPQLPMGAVRFFGEAQRLEEHWRLWSRETNAVASKASMEALSMEMKQLAEDTRPSEEQEAAKDALFRQVEQAGKESLDGCTAELFGSAGTKQWMPGSDLDICLLAPDVTTSASQVRSLRKVARALRQTGASHNIQPRFHAQMPILRWTPRRPDRPGSIACDISVGNVLAVANTRLMASYLDLDDRVPLLLRAIKVWARKRGINNRQRGSFSSFALTLMLIHVLQKRPEPVLPSLQDLAIQQKMPPLFLQGADCRFCSDLSLSRASLAPNKESLGELFLEFFRYYGYVYDCGAIAIRDTSSFTMKFEGRQSFFVVDNPFEPGKDVANIEVRLFTRLREEFRRAHAVLCEGSGLAELCQAPPVPGTDPLAGMISPGLNAPAVPK